MRVQKFIACIGDHIDQRIADGTNIEGFGRHVDISKKRTRDIGLLMPESARKIKSLSRYVEETENVVRNLRAVPTNRLPSAHAACYPKPPDNSQQFPAQFRRSNNVWSTQGRR